MWQLGCLPLVDGNCDSAMIMFWHQHMINNHSVSMCSGEDFDTYQSIKLLSKSLILLTCLSRTRMINRCPLNVILVIRGLWKNKKQTNKLQKKNLRHQLVYRTMQGNDWHIWYFLFYCYSVSRLTRNSFPLWICSCRQRCQSVWALESILQHPHPERDAGLRRTSPATSPGSDSCIQLSLAPDHCTHIKYNVL